jgi:hypothetical protein
VPQACRGYLSRHSAPIAEITTYEFISQLLNALLNIQRFNAVHTNARICVLVFSNRLIPYYNFSCHCLVLIIV